MENRFKVHILPSNAVTNLGKIGNKFIIPSESYTGQYYKMFIVKDRPVTLADFDITELGMVSEMKLVFVNGELKKIHNEQITDDCRLVVASPYGPDGIFPEFIECWIANPDMVVEDKDWLALPQRWWKSLSIEQRNYILQNVAYFDLNEAVVNWYNSHQNYTYRNLLTNSKWAVSGVDTKTNTVGLLEKCLDEDDAEEMLSIMKLYPQFKDLQVVELAIPESDSFTPLSDLSNFEQHEQAYIDFAVTILNKATISNNPLVFKHDSDV